ncbi:hypothetical protein MJD09_07425, partial [bacterium]|nr:hypothetical protein [bacterium]
NCRKASGTSLVWRIGNGRRNDANRSRLIYVHKTPVCGYHKMPNKGPSARGTIDDAILNDIPINGNKLQN